MVDLVKCRLKVRVQRPHPPAGRPPGGDIDSLDRVPAASAGPKPIGSRLKPCLPLGLQRVDRQGLQAPVDDHRNAKPAELPVGLGYEHSLDWPRLPRRPVPLHPAGQLGLDLGQQHDLAVDACRLATSVLLRYPSHAQQGVGAGTQHQLLKVADLGKVPCPRCREDPLSESPYVVLDGSPVDRVPVEEVALRSVHPAARSRHGRGRCRGLRRRGVQRAHRLWWLHHRLVTDSPDPRQRPFRPEHRLVSGQLCGTSSGGAALAVPASCCPFGCRRWLLGSSCARWGVGPSSRSAYRTRGVPDPIGVVMLRMRKTRPGRAPP